MTPDAPSPARKRTKKAMENSHDEQGAGVDRASQPRNDLPASIAALTPKERRRLAALKALSSIELLLRMDTAENDSRLARELNGCEGLGLVRGSMIARWRHGTSPHVRHIEAVVAAIPVMFARWRQQQHGHFEGRGEERAGDR